MPWGCHSIVFQLNNKNKYNLTGSFPICPVNENLTSTFKHDQDYHSGFKQSPRSLNMMQRKLKTKSTNMF